MTSTLFRFMDCKVLAMIPNLGTILQYTLHEPEEGLILVLYDGKGDSKIYFAGVDGASSLPGRRFSHS